MALALLALAVPAAAGVSVTYGYDQQGQLISVTKSTGEVVSYYYDAAGNRASIGLPVTNHAPTCTNYVVGPISAPTYATVTVTITAAALIGRCTDSDGNTLTVASPTPVPFDLHPASGSTTTIAFTVSDGQGATGGANIVVTRN
ncbi:RHS repeat domain-containing protein [Caulobacter sp. LARHSG274]